MSGDMLGALLKTVIAQKTPEILSTVAEKVIGWLRTQKAPDLDPICEEMSQEDAAALRAMWRAVQVPVTPAKP